MTALALVILTSCMHAQPVHGETSPPVAAATGGLMQIQGHVNRFVDKKIVIDAPPPVGVIIYRWVTVIDVDPDQGVPFEHIEARHRAMPTDARWTDLNAPICIEVDQGLLHLDSQDGVVSSDVAALHFCP